MITLSDCINPNSVDVSELTASGLVGLHIPLLTHSFFHCKNVNRLDVTKEEGPSPKWCRRQRVPELKYHALQIDPNLGSNKVGERKTEGDRSGKALHICRGHFMHCVNDGVNMGLFGRGVYGTFWVPSHTRGTLEQGKVLSTYTVKVPDDLTSTFR
jgi:hypothetical protein